MLQTELFPKEKSTDIHVLSFYASDLGQIYEQIPFRKLAQQIDTQRSGMGRPSTLTTAGKLALCVLKHYYNGISDKKLVEMLNTNPCARLFCELPAAQHQHQWIRDEDLPSKTRQWLAKYLVWEEVDHILVNVWKEDLEDTQISLMDATCYESNVAFPTDLKLLWSSCEWIWTRLVSLCKNQRIRCPRNKYKDIEKAVLHRFKSRQKSYKKERKVRKRVLNLLEKLLWQLEQHFPDRLARQWTKRWEEHLNTIKTVLEQQKEHYQDLSNNKSIKDRIVSLHKPYLRPIKRGKENKPVEFGFKAHVIQIGGLNFMEFMDSKAFHEGIRLKEAIYRHRQLVGKCTHLSADRIYANNKNRKWTTAQKLINNFDPKGPKAKDEKQRSKMRKILNVARSTRLEGSFGTEKEHYGLKKIRARTYDTEIIWIRMGILTANAARLVRKKKQSKAA